MTRGSRTEVISVLRRFVHGQLTFDELQGFVRSKNFGWLDELLDGIQLGEHDYAEIALDEHVLSRPLADYVAGRIGSASFADWSFETYRIISSGAYPTSTVYSPSVEISLLFVCLITECEMHGRLRSARAIAERILDALERGQRVPAESVLRRVLQGLRVVQLITRPRSTEEIEDGIASQWADLALATSPLGGGEPDPEDCWFTPLAVCTRDLWVETPPEGPWAHPENDRMHSLREQFPQLDLDTDEPMYFVGPDGLAELVLDVERIDEGILRSAARLFCLRNRVRRCTLDGTLCYPTREDR